MFNLTPKEKLNIYQNLFKGRDDVFAVHWENKDKTKTGYSPVCFHFLGEIIQYIGRIQRKATLFMIIGL